MLKKLSDQLHGFVYSLFYPGVLGSMIFDLFDPLREESYTQIALFSIAGLFAVDYIHLRYNICVHPENKENSDSRPLIDAAIALFFCFGYFALSATTSNTFPVSDKKLLYTHQGVSLLFISFSLCLATYYNFSSTSGWKWKNFPDAMGKIIPAAICLITACIAYIGKMNDFRIAMLTCLAAAVYSIYVIFLANKRKVPTIQINDKVRDFVIFIVCLFMFIGWVMYSSSWKHVSPIEDKVLAIEERINNIDKDINQELYSKYVELGNRADKVETTMQEVINAIKQIDSNTQMKKAEMRIPTNHIQELDPNETNSNFD